MSEILLFLSIFFNLNAVPNVALTFDADMTPGMEQQLKNGEVKSWYNSKIIDYLQKNNVPATLFLSGMWVENYPEVTQLLAKNQLFEIANHSYSHPGFTSNCFNLPPVPSWGKKGEFIKSQQAIKKITGITAKLFRFPGGCHNPEDIKLAQSYGLTTIDWDVASGDSFNNNLSQIIHNVETKTKSNSIIVFHLHGNRNAPLTDQALAVVVPYLRQKGFHFVKVSDLL